MKKNTEPLIPDTIYHIYNRGINGETIFKEFRNYNYFLEKYALYIEPIAKTFAYSLMGNHFPFAVQTKTENELTDFYYKKYPKKTEIPHFSKILGQQFANLFNSYTQSINKAVKRSGGLFEEPFRRIAVEDEKYFSHLIHYIHFNPQAHGFVADYKTYEHSSFQAYLKTTKSRLQRDEVIKWFGNKDEFIKFHEGQIDKKIWGKFEVE